MEDTSLQSQTLEICTDVFQSTFATRRLAEKASESVKKVSELGTRYSLIENDLVSGLDMHL